MPPCLQQSWVIWGNENYKQQESGINSKGREAQAAHTSIPGTPSNHSFPHSLFSNTFSQHCARLWGYSRDKYKPKPCSHGAHGTFRAMRQAIKGQRVKESRGCNGAQSKGQPTQTGDGWSEAFWKKWHVTLNPEDLWS